MRALMLVHSYYVRDTRPRRLATALADAGWEVDVLCARDAGELPRERVGNVNVIRLPARRRRASKLRYLFEYTSFALMAFLAVTRCHLTRRYRVVHVIGIPNFIVFAALVPRLTGARVLLDMRDPLPEFFRARYGLAEEHRLVKALLTEEKLSARFASKVVTVHESMAELYNRSVPREKVVVVMNPPDPRLFEAQAERNPDGHTLLYTGTLGAQYGVDVAIRAVAELRDEIPDLRLRVVAKNTGADLEALRRLAADHGVAERVSFEPPVPLDQIPAIAAEAWLGVQPGRDDPLMRYSLSAKILEWCRLGLPVVAGATAPLRELLDEGSVLFHPLGDLDGLCARIREAHGDPPGLARRAARAREAAAVVSYEGEMARYLALVGS